MIKTVRHAYGSYNIVIERGALSRVSEYMKLDRRVLIVTDDGVPSSYAKTVADACKSPTIVTLPQGEASKNLSNFELLCRRMLTAGFTRTDAVVAVGGGVCGDLAGFAAASFMRGIDFYNIPTTLLSQVDSSVGGKTAVDLGGIKNCIGAFYQPKAVVIDPDVLVTLPARQLSSGLAEVIKMAATSDEKLFCDLENGLADRDLVDVIDRALTIKQSVVEADEKESGLRRVLNFGHTVGHGIESTTGLFHGECVALGMLPMCSDKVNARLISLYKTCGLPTTVDCDPDAVAEAVTHDKKLDGATLSTVYVDQIGRFEFRKIIVNDFKILVKEALTK